MKRFWTGILTLVTLLALVATVSADVLWEPNNNTFYYSHHDECDYLGRRYYANSAEGFVTVWNAPDGSMVVDQFENGFKMWVYWVYENWGLVSIRGDEETVEGWVDLEEMSLVYDYISFAEEYADEIKPYNGEFAGYEGSLAVINFYEYPGAPSVKLEYSYSESSVRKALMGTSDSPSYIQSIYVDEEGLTWGFVGYMYGRLNGWFCLDDPDGINDGETTTFPVRRVEEAELTPAQEPSLPAKGYIPYLLVGAAVVVTAGILAVFFRKKKRRSNS